MVEIVDEDFQKIEYDPNMTVNVSPSKTIREAWDWALGHNLEFEFVVEGIMVSVTKNAKDRIREMLDPTNFSRIMSGAGPDHNIDFLFNNQEDLMAFKLRWS